MIQIFVRADDADGNPWVADHYHFAAVPRVGEQITVDNGTEKNLLLCIVGVTHLSETTEDEMSPISYVQLKWELVD